jgi:hypothetical protein
MKNVAHSNDLFFENMRDNAIENSWNEMKSVDEIDGEFYRVSFILEYEWIEDFLGMPK